MIQKLIGVFGSIAFDHLYTFDGAIRDFLASQQQKNVSISLFSQNRTVQDGGCGGNIAHALSLLGVPSILFGTVGEDAHPYMKRLAQQGVQTDYVSFTALPTATASIVTDRNQDQCALFYAGALGADARPDFHNCVQKLSALIVSPEDPGRFQFMVENAQKAGIPYYCDPGQVIGILPTPFLHDALEKSAGLFCNTYELDLLSKKMKKNPAALIAQLPLAVITNGEHGTTVYTKDGKHVIPAVPAQTVRNVTGCGDAFRGGFLAGVSKNLSVKTSAKVGTLIATYVVESDRPQISDFSLKNFRERYQTAFDEVCPV